jgi:hypothetical protein
MARTGPPGPEKERPGGYQAARPDQKLADTTTNNHHDNRPGRQAPYDALVGNGRRFAASRRMEPIPTCRCGRCVRDPDYDRHRCGDEISDRMAEAAVAAVELLDGMGLPALLDDRTCRAVWRVGRRDLAVESYRRSHGEVAS